MNSRLKLPQNVQNLNKKSKTYPYHVVGNTGNTK